MSMQANTPKHVARMLRRALAAHPQREHAYQLGALQSSVAEAVRMLEEQPDPRELAAELDALRQSLLDHASCVRRKAGEPAHRVSQLLGAIEAGNMRLELLSDRLVQRSQYINYLLTTDRQEVTQQ